MIREAPAWFNDELERVGGTNRYGEPIFRLMWSQEVRSIIGGKFNDGFVGYRNARLLPGDPHWALMIWESPESYGDPDLWEYDFRQLDTGLLDCGSFPKYGRYRLLKQMMHRELVQQEKSEMVWNPYKKRPELVRRQNQRFVTYKMEPCGLILDLMLPMLMAWRLLGPAAEARSGDGSQEAAGCGARSRREGCDGRLPVRRGSLLVQKRAELIEKGMDQAMRIASRFAQARTIWTTKTSRK